MEVIGVPFDLCGARAGSRLGPSAIRLAGLHDSLAYSKISVGADSDIEPSGPTSEPGIRNFEPARAAYRQIRERVKAALEAGNFPLVLGGDHSLSIASVGAALSHHGDKLSLLWVDAHADLNTPDTSPSGNLHGMPLGCLLGEPSELHGGQWRELQAEFAPTPLLAERVAWMGLRDLDPGEKGRIAKYPREYVSTMSDIDRRGLMGEIERFDTWMRSNESTGFWLSFDVDVLDPILAPGTGTAVRGGLTYREMHLLGEMIYELTSKPDCPYRLIGMDLVETNPLVDSNNATAKVAVEFVSSLFGKSILGL